MSHTTKPARLPVAGHPQQARTPTLIIVVYAVVVYLFFLVVLCYAAGFFAGFGVPKGIDDGSRAAVPAAVAVDLLLLLLFAVQHTVMARPWFKRRWTRIVPEPAERASFVLTASLVLALLFWAGHLLFAVAATGYILVGIAFEEHDLIQSLGGTYAAYRARVPALTPRPWLRRPPPGSWRSEENDMKQAT